MTTIDDSVNRQSEKKLYKSLGNLVLDSRWYKDLTGEKPPAQLLRTSDPRLRERAGLIYRGLGFIVCIIVLYLWAFDVFRSAQLAALIWVGVYLIFLVVLEFIRVLRRKWFDSPLFRVLRILLNVAAMTWLLSIPSDARAVLGLFYIFPVYAAIIYFPESRHVIFTTFFLVIVGLVLAGFVFNSANPLNLLQVGLVVVALVVFSWALTWFQHNVIFGADLISRVGVRLHQTLDIQELANSVVDASIMLTQASRALIIIVDPEYQGYVKHAEVGFDLREGASIADVARKCTVINHATFFSCPDMESHFNNKDIYSTYFKCNPKSVVATPLFNRGGTVIGMLTVASDKANCFDATTNDLVRGFGYLVSSAVENSLIHRQVKLREIRSRSITQSFARAHDEREIFNLVLKEAKQAIPYANCVMHRLERKALPSDAGDEFILAPWMWDADNYNNLIPSATEPGSFRYGYGLAGHALKIREPIIANDVDKHPLYVKLQSDSLIHSLLVCPLFNPNGTDDYGTISLFGSETNVFNQEDELVISSLAHQASLAISKIREFEEWQEQGGILRQILNEVRYFDFGSSEGEFCNQLSSAAIKLLNFRMARIRIMDERTKELVTVAVSGLTEEAARSMIGHRMPAAILDPFINKEYQLERSYIVPHKDRRWKEIADRYFYIPQVGRRKKTEWKPYDALLTPLIGPSGQMLGLLTLDLPEDGSYPTKTIMEPIGLFASMAGWAIELARYQRRFLDQKDRARSFIETISDDIAQGHDFQTLGNVVVQIGAKLISAEGCNLFMVRENEIELTHSTYLSTTDLIGRRKPICDKPGCGLTGWVAKRGQTLLFNNGEFKNHPSWAHEEMHLRYLPSRRCNSTLLTPILDDQENVLGVLALENKRRSSELVDFDDDDRVRMTSLAAQLARALIRIGRYESIKKWESKGLEDDLHFLINWYRFGVLARIEQLDDALYKEDLGKAKALMPDLMRNARNSVNELKALHTMIINECLEANELREGLERLVDAWRKRVVPAYNENTPMQINLNCPEILEIDLALRNTILRIASEALSNSIFHSGIIEDSKIQIQIDVRPGKRGITLNIRDNGVGAKALREGVGIDRMNQLTKQVNSWGGIKAELRIKSVLQKGTQVRFTAAYQNR
jgi:GAF domain-containing protein